MTYVVIKFSLVCEFGFILSKFSEFSCSAYNSLLSNTLDISLAWLLRLP